MLAALREEIAKGASWRAIERRLGVNRKCVQDHAFKVGLVSSPSRCSRFGRAWRRAHP